MFLSRHDRWSAAVWIHNRQQRKLAFAERLEDRRVMAAGDYITEMSVLAGEFATKSTPTMLYLNFDGRSPVGERSTVTPVSPFQSFSRDLDIQEILFRTSEIFAPFNVQVVRMHGLNNYDSSSDGNSTIFIGDHPEYTTTVGGRTVNGTGAFTPAAYTDYPADVRLGPFDLHQLNSDPYDLAYVDPWNGASNWNNRTIAQAIAHEAGHTFGLAHVLSFPSQDAMSYDAVNAAFLDQAFNITNLNNTSTGLVVQPSVVSRWYFTNVFGGTSFNNLLTQNSFDTLTTLLGRRSTSGDNANVADRRAVDPGFVDGAMPTISVAQSRNASINRLGDYDVYSFTPTTSGVMRLEVENTDGSFLMPTVMLYRTDTDSFVFRAHDADADGEVQNPFIVQAGVSYRVIVGAVNSRTTGAYRLSLDVGGYQGENPSVNVSWLTSSQDGWSDTVDISTNNGHFLVTVNSQVVFSDRIDHLGSFTLEGTTDFETFRVNGTMPFNVTLRGGSGADRITSPSGSNEWVFSNINAGRLNSNVVFASMENILGGSGADVFKMGNGWIDGRIDGGGGTDTLDYSWRTWSNTVNLGLGTASSVFSGIGSIENATGGSGNDTLIGSSAANVLRGGGGNDTLRGGAGNDQLFGDAGADWLYGEAGVDYLDGGYDQAVDYLFGDNDGALDEADYIVLHQYFDGYKWRFEDSLANLRPNDRRIVVVH